jgi:DNA-binding transcriptional MerR regulator
MAQYRIDALAHAAGTSVRNVRYYQDNGMLPPPRRVGRVAWYDEGHLSRLRMILRLLERGYTAANIVELVEAWEKGHDLADVLGLEPITSHPASPEASTSISASQLCEIFGAPTPRADLLEKVVQAGLAMPEGEGYRLTNPRSVRALGALASKGTPIPLVLELAGRLRGSLDDVLRGLAQATAAQLLPDRASEASPTTTDIPELAALVHQVRPLINSAVTATLNVALEGHLAEVLADYIRRFLPDPNGATPTPVTTNV